MRRLLCSILCLLSLFVAGPIQAAPPETTTLDLSSAAGIKWDFKPEGGDWKSIAVPAGGWRAQGYTCDAGTYRARIPIPANAQGRLVRLAFAAVNFGADVYVGTDEAHLTKIASHIDGWVPFDADVTPYVTPGSKVLLQVEVKGRRKFMVNGKYTVPEGATWDALLEEGILRGVSLQLLPLTHIDNAYVRTRLAPDTVQPQVTVTNNSSKPASINIAATFAGAWNKDSFRYPKIPNVTVSLPPGATRALDLGQLAWAAGPQSYWWPNVPYKPGYQAQLHLLNITLKVDGKVVQHYQQRFGFRQFQARGAHYELNGIHCNLRGDNQQEADFGTDAYGIRPGFGPPSRGNGGWPEAVDNILRLNFNVMRIHQIPATPYMLDVCDEKGLMLVEESPLRGSEGGEDFKNGHDNMLNMDRELVMRDRNHAAVVIWSAANEWTEPIREAVPVIQAVDDTRPIIADGVGDMSAPYINMQHYTPGLGGLPINGGTPRADRPYGETESIWPMDNTWQGFAWMGTSIRLRRLKGNADLRNYVLNNAWPNYVPGEDEKNEILEKKVKNMGGDMAIHPALTDPWHNPLIHLMQQCYHPLAVCDTDFDLQNARSNAAGDWPTVKPRLATGSHVTRRLAVFNDEFSGENVQLRWQAHNGSGNGPVIAGGQFALRIPLGEFRYQDISFDAPATPGDIYLSLATAKRGVVEFTENQIAFRVVNGSAALVPDGDYRLGNLHSGKVAVPNSADDDAPVAQQTSGNGDIQLWHLKNLGHNDVTLTNKQTGLLLGGRGAAGADEALAVQQKPNGGSSQIWHLDEVGDSYTLTNKGSGKVLDVYSSATADGARIVQWTANNGENQEWQVR